MNRQYPVITEPYVESANDMYYFLSLLTDQCQGKPSMLCQVVCSILRVSSSKHHLQFCCVKRTAQTAPNELLEEA